MAALVRPMNLRFPHLVTFLLFSYQFPFVSCVCHVNMAPPFVSEPLLEFDCMIPDTSLGKLVKLGFFKDGEVLMIVKTRLSATETS